VVAPARATPGTGGHGRAAERYASSRLVGGAPTSRVESACVGRRRTGPNRRGLPCRAIQVISVETCKFLATFALRRSAGARCGASRCRVNFCTYPMYGVAPSADCPRPGDCVSVFRRDFDAGIIGSPRPQSHARAGRRVETLWRAIVEDFRCAKFDFGTSD
jgi:hypothetical protein